MTKAELREKIRALALQVVGEKSKAEDAALAYDELTKFPELKDVIVNLLTHEFDSFLEDIQWVAPKPTTFRIILLNGQSFLLTYSPRSWVAQVEGSIDNFEGGGQSIDYDEDEFESFEEGNSDGCDYDARENPSEITFHFGDKEVKFDMNYDNLYEFKEITYTKDDIIELVNSFSAK